jgi:hypothetical protein
VIERAARPAARARALATLAAALALGGCGRDEPKAGPLLVEVVTASADGAAPPGFSLRSEDGKRSVALAPTKDAGVLAGDGPHGRYHVAAPSGWGVVGATGAIEFRPGLSPTPVPVGRANSIYLVAATKEPTGDVEVLRHDDGSDAPVPHERANGADGRVVLRLKPEEWRGKLKVTAVVGTSLLSAPRIVSLPDGGAPVGVRIAPGPNAALDVRLFRPEDGTPAAGVDVSVVGALGPLAIRATGRTDADGLARIPALATVVPHLVLHQGLPAPQTVIAHLPSADWRLAGEARCATLSPGSLSSVTVEVPNEHDRTGVWTLIQVRPPGARTYALVDPPSVEVTNSTVAPQLLLPPGARCAVYVRRGDRAGMRDLLARPGSRHTIELQPLCKLRVKVAASRGEAHRVRVLCRRQEGGEEVLAQGWSVVADAPGIVDVALPVGSYRISVLDGAREGPSVAWTFEKPGSVAEMELTPP